MVAVIKKVLSKISFFLFNSKKKVYKSFKISNKISKTQPLVRPKGDKKFILILHLLNTKKRRDGNLLLMFMKTLETFHSFVLFSLL